MQEKMTEFFHVIRGWLEEECHIKAPEDWLQACIEWIESENEGDELTCDALQQLVYEQWLLSDLNEVGASCLPHDINEHAKMELPGSYCLQVNSAVNVASALYGQLQKVEGTENENAHVTATQVTQKWNEPKGNRMLILHMTDGTTEIQGMEYQPVPQLSTAISPGSKIVVQGPVLCRLGVLMLKRQHVQVLGGEVDTLAENNTQKELLTSRLQSNEALRENRPELGRREGTGQFTKKAPTQRATQEQKPFWQPRDAAQKCPSKTSEILMDDDDDFLQGINTEQLDQLEQEWDDGIDYSNAVTNMDNLLQQAAPVVIKPENSASQTQSGMYDMRVHEECDLAQTQAQGKCFTRHGESDEIRECARSRNSSNTQNASHSSFGKNFARYCPQETSETFPQTQESRSFRNDGINVQQNELEYPRSMEFEESAEMRERSGHLGRQESGDRGQSIVKKPLFATLRNADFCSSDNVLSKQNVPGKILQPRQTSIDAFMCNKQGKHQSWSLTTTEASNVPLSTTVPSNKRTNESISEPSATHVLDKLSVKTELVNDPPDSERRSRKKLRPSTSPDATHNVTGEDELIVTDARRAEPTSAHSGCDIRGTDRSLWCGPPFTYIAEIKGQRPVQHCAYIIKAYIVTLLSKLDYNQGSHWSLRVKLNDGSSTWDVQLGNEMLADLIGFTARQCQDVKTGTVSDKATKARLAKGLKHFQQELVKMSSMMKIEVGGQRSEPYVTKVWRPASADIELLKQRVTNHSR